LSVTPVLLVGSHWSVT